MCIGCGVCQEVCPRDAIDYSQKDEYLTITTKEFINYPQLEEGRFEFENDINLKSLYKDSLNTLTLREFEYMLNPQNPYSGQPLCPTDGKIAKEIAFLHIPNKDFLNEELEQLDNLQFKYILKQMDYIHNYLPDTNITLFTNTTELGELPMRYRHLFNDGITIEKLKKEIKLISIEGLKIEEHRENGKIVIEYNGNNNEFDLCIIGTGFRYKKD
jgi:heterodisulfide reductase subunit A-like polyferredoxin